MSYLTYFFSLCLVNQLANFGLSYHLPCSLNWNDAFTPNDFIEVTVCYIVSVKKLFLPQMISCSHSITPAWLFLAFEFIPTSNAVDISICNSYEYQYTVLHGHMAIIRFTRNFHRFSNKMSNLHNPKLQKLIVALW